MYIVKVTYTANAGYTKHNQENINNVMTDMRKIDHPGIRYCTYMAEDGKTFTHLALFKEQALQKILFDLPSFQKFQMELKESKPETMPKTEHLALVGSSFEIFI